MIVGVPKVGEFSVPKVIEISVPKVNEVDRRRVSKISMLPGRHEVSVLKFRGIIHCLKFYQLMYLHFPHFVSTTDSSTIIDSKLSEGG